MDSPMESEGLLGTGLVQRTGSRVRHPEMIFGRVVGIDDSNMLMIF
jgi:hypothetical protein